MTQPERFHRLPDEAERETRLQRKAFERQHDELAHWGEVLLHGAKGDEPLVIEGDELPKRIWTREDEARAEAVNRRVNLLDPKTRFALRVFYKGREAKHWSEYGPNEQRQILTDMCRELNARWRRYCADAGQEAEPIGWYQLESIWRSTVVMLARTAEVPFPQHPCG